MAECRGADALRWLRRARRLAPNDAAVALALASATLGADPHEAARLAAQAVKDAPSREAWLCLIAARHRAGEYAQAADDLRQLLARYVSDTNTERLAAALVDTGALPEGWCGIGASGRLRLRAVGTPVLHLDAARLPVSKTLPPRWRTAKTLSVTVGGAHVAGSPFDLVAMRRIEGIVAGTPDGGIQGWCWHPGAPETSPDLNIVDAVGIRRPIALGQAAQTGAGMFARRHTFSVTASQLKRLSPPFHVRGADGQNLPGSPVDPTLEQRAASGRARTFLPYHADLRGSRAMPARRHPVAVVIPVHNGGATVAACLSAVRAHTPRGTPLIVVDDASTDPEIRALLRRWSRHRDVQLIRHATNRGFPAAANSGMRRAAGHDIVLLNSDALTPAGWLPALRSAAYAAPDIGTASPLSNDATILSYPAVDVPLPPPDAADTASLAADAALACGNAVVEVPTTVGFCMYIRRDCLQEVGLFREDLFAQGYGEENDFCLRARRLGWRHVAATGAFVGHIGGASFGTAREALIQRNLAILERLHPGWNAVITAFAAADPLFPSRRSIDLLRWRKRLKPRLPGVLLVSHDDGGGVEQALRARVATLRKAGLRPIFLRPTPEGHVRITAEGLTDLMDLRFDLPREWPLLLRTLRAAEPREIEYHHTLGHHPSVFDLPERLGLPFRVAVHDYAWLCPRVNLLGRHERYCGEPDARACDRCVADNGRVIEEEISTGELRARSATFLAAAAGVVAPSDDARARLRRHFPDIVVRTEPHEDDRAWRPRPPAPRAETVVAVVGAVGAAKGYDVLLDCARDAADRDLRLHFVLVGHSTDDRRLLDTGRCFVTGPFAAGAASELIAQEDAQLGFIPSVWPETWCYALSDIWRAGLYAVSFDIGAPAERIRATGGGRVLPLGLPAPAINNALLAAVRQIGHV